MISFEESMQILQSLEVAKCGVQKLFLSDALGRFLAEDIVAKEDNPEAPTAAMDGYAIRFDDQDELLEVIDSVPAGDAKEIAVFPKTAIKTFTGSLMPKNADTLVPIEHVKLEDEKIKVVEPVPKGYSVRPVGENFKKGEKLIAKGARIGFAEIGVMGSLNIVMPKVYQRPKVAILATGSEVLEIGQQKSSSAQIRSSNNYTLCALARLHGAEPIQLGAVKDDKSSITKALQEALTSADIVVTTGGVSVGDYDFVKDVVKDALGAQVAFKGVVIKPGQHVMVATLGKKFIVSLPGFAYSSTVTFLLYVVPLIYRMQGSEYQPKIVLARLMEPFKKKSKKSEFTPCRIYIQDGEFMVDFSGNKEGSSAIMTNMLGSDRGLLITSPQEGDKEAGEMARVWLINTI